MHGVSQSMRLSVRGAITLRTCLLESFAVKSPNDLAHSFPGKEAVAAQFNQLYVASSCH